MPIDPYGHVAGKLVCPGCGAALVPNGFLHEFICPECRPGAATEGSPTMPTDNKVIQHQAALNRPTTGRRLKCLGCGAEGNEPIMHYLRPTVECTGPYEVIGHAPIQPSELPWRDDDPREVLKDIERTTILISADGDFSLAFYRGGQPLYTERLLGTHVSDQPISKPWPEGWRWILLSKEAS